MRRECQVFSCYLIGRTSCNYVVGRYLAAHSLGVLGSGVTRFEYLLVRIACRHRLLTRAADAYSRFFAPRSALRNKLVLLLALLETSAPSYRWFDAVPSGGRIRVITALLFQVFTGMVCLLGGLVLFAPIQLLTRFEKSA